MKNIAVNKFLVSVLMFLAFSCLNVSAAEKSTVLIKDFRGINLFEAFYTYDKENDRYNFVPVSNADYILLSRENKTIYRKTLNADKYLRRSRSPVFQVNSIKYRQKALKNNPDLLPAAYELIGEFKNEKKYSTALYYAERVKKRDKKNRYPEISFEIGELYYLINDYDHAQSNLAQYLKVSQKTPAKVRDAYTILADCSEKLGTDHKQALQYADRALSLDKNNTQALESKYNSLTALKSYRSAMNIASQLMNISPDDHTQALKYAECRGALGDKKTQLIYLQKALKLAQTQNKPKNIQASIESQIKIVQKK